MKNNVQLVIDETNMKPFYKIELYLSVENLQDMRYSDSRDRVPCLIGNTVLDEITMFKETFQEEFKTRMVRETKIMAP